MDIMHMLLAKRADVNIRLRSRASWAEGLCAKGLGFRVVKRVWV